MAERRLLVQGRRKYPRRGEPRQRAPARGHHFLKHIRPNSSGNTKLYIGSDGGLAMNWLGTDQVHSDYNRNLRTLQMYSSLIRMFYGTLSAHPDPARNGPVCAGTQDNGNVYCWPAPNLTPWRQIGGCYGGPNLFLASGQLVRNPMCGGDGSTLGCAKVEGIWASSGCSPPRRGRPPPRACTARPSSGPATATARQRIRSPLVPCQIGALAISLCRCVHDSARAGAGSCRRVSGGFVASEHTASTRARPRVASNSVRAHLSKLVTCRCSQNAPICAGSATCRFKAAD
jgi:hypothetical protein